MKFLSLIFCLILAVPFSYAKDTPLPWPLATNVLPIDQGELPGSWVAYDHNTIWFVEIQPDDENADMIHIDLRSNGIRTHHVEGYMVLGEKLYVGTLKNEDDRYYVGSLYLDKEGYKIRVFRSKHSYFDLRLYKNK
ncbi:hypothetical protein [Bdellovibrio sp. HCB2-146]|uniref:hypothetical protein n=1 Tax=Bdellovibrio sp. HCB2-146 TaxID=3394362 RepID=UPI0039BCD06D